MLDLLHNSLTIFSVGLSRAQHVTDPIKRYALTLILCVTLRDGVKWSSRTFWLTRPSPYPPYPPIYLAASWRS